MKKRIIFFLLILTILALISIYSNNFTGNQVSNYYSDQQIILTRVVDGDTIKDQFNQSYRLLGINNTKV